MVAYILAYVTLSVCCNGTALNVLSREFVDWPYSPTSMPAIDIRLRNVIRSLRDDVQISHKGDVHVQMVARS